MPPVSCPHLCGCWYRTMRMLQLRKARFALGPIHIKDHKIRVPAGSDANVCIGRFAPPVCDDGWIGSGRFETAFNPRMLARTFAVQFSTGTNAVSNRVKGKYSKSRSCIGQCPVLHGLKFC